MSEQGILIAGGYGVVGQRIAAALARDYPVIVAGRHLEQAKATAAAIGHGVRGRKLDVTVASSIAAALQGVAAVVSCIDQPGRGLLQAAIERGLRYTDITPHLTELGRGAGYEEIGAAARRSGARLVLGTGIVPGISNVIVRAFAHTLGGADEIETSLLLNAARCQRPGIVRLFLKELTMPFAVHVDGKTVQRRAFSDAASGRVPPAVWTAIGISVPVLRSGAVPLPWALRTALTRLAIEPGWDDGLSRRSPRRVAARRDGTIRHAIAQTARDGSAPNKGARFALRVDVIRDGIRGTRRSFGGPRQMPPPPGGAAVRALMEGEVSEPGAWMPEQVI